MASDQSMLAVGGDGPDPGAPLLALGGDGAAADPGPGLHSLRGGGGSRALDDAPREVDAPREDDAPWRDDVLPSVSNRASLLFAFGCVDGVVLLADMVIVSRSTATKKKL
mmetsp:Transcript_28896/g.46483  ORF Transcript_28896/g.46483 Transcript_28896/m.46483 type:complete len:110 (+) Transcript_28896:109-438(+)